MHCSTESVKKLESQVYQLAKNWFTALSNATKVGSLQCCCAFTYNTTLFVYLLFRFTSLISSVVKYWQQILLLLQARQTDHHGCGFLFTYSPPAMKRKLIISNQQTYRNALECFKPLYQSQLNLTYTTKWLIDITSLINWLL